MKERVLKTVGVSLGTGLTFFGLGKMLEVTSLFANPKLKSPSPEDDFILNMLLVAAVSFAAARFWWSVFEHSDQTSGVRNFFKTLDWKIKGPVTGSVSALILYGFAQTIQCTVFFATDSVKVTNKQNFINSMFFLGIAIPLLTLFFSYYMRRQQLQEPTAEQGMPLVPANYAPATSYNTATL